MSEELLAPSPEFLRFLLSNESGGFTPFERALDGLSGEDAVRRPDGCPHSVAEVVAHMVFWLERHLRMIDGEPPTPVPNASVGWPAVTAEEWPGLVQRYLAGLERYRSIAQDEAAVKKALVDGRDRSVGASIVSYYVHDAHHLGQVILIRRMIGAWPPPGGGDSW